MWQCMVLGAPYFGELQYTECITHFVYRTATDVREQNLQLAVN